MTVGPVFFHSQHGVQQQYALLGPAGEITVGRRGTVEIIVQFLKHIAQRRRNFDALPDGKGQTVGFSRSMIGVLPQNDHSYLVRRCQGKHTKHLIFRRVDGDGGAGFIHTAGQFCKIGLLQFRLQQRQPRAQRGKVHIQYLLK